MADLANGLGSADRDEEAMAVWDACLETGRRYKHVQYFEAQLNAAATYQKLGRFEEALAIRRESWEFLKGMKGCPETVAGIALNLVSSLYHTQRYGEAKEFARQQIAIVERHGLGETKVAIELKECLSVALCQDDKESREDFRESLAILEDIVPTARRVFGGENPITKRLEANLTAGRIRGMIHFPRKDGEDPYGPVGDLQDALASQREHQRRLARAAERAGEPAVARSTTDEVLEEFAAARLDERRRRGRG